jgi:hypothetical protein
LVDFLKSPPLKPLGPMNQNLVGSIYGMSSIKIAYIVPIRWAKNVIKFGQSKTLIIIRYAKKCLSFFFHKPSPITLQWQMWKSSKLKGNMTYVAILSQS